MSDVNGVRTKDWSIETSFGNFTPSAFALDLEKDLFRAASSRKIHEKVVKSGDITRREHLPKTSETPLPAIWSY